MAATQRLIQYIAKTGTLRAHPAPFGDKGQTKEPSLHQREIETRFVCRLSETINYQQQRAGRDGERPR